MSDTATAILKVLGIVALGVLSIQIITTVCRCSGLRSVPYVEVVPIAWMRKKLGTPNVTIWGTPRGEYGVGGRLPMNRVNISTQGSRLPENRVLIDTKFSKDPQGTSLLPGMQQTPAVLDGIAGPKLCPIDDINCSGTSPLGCGSCGGAGAGMVPLGIRSRSCPSNDPTCSNVQEDAYLFPSHSSRQASQTRCEVFQTGCCSVSICKSGSFPRGCTKLA